MLTKAIKSGLGRFGYSLIRFSHLSHDIRSFIQANNVSLVLDVGAHHGEYCRMLREEVGYRGQIVSFEPCSASFQTLRTRMDQDRKWRGFQFGLSDKDTTAILNTYGTRGDFNSILHLREKDARVYGVTSEAASTEVVELHKLDTIWHQTTEGLNSSRVLLKVDTQGYDMAVVKGALSHLESVFGIQSELSSIEIYDGMTSMSDALRLYRELGFLPVSFYAVNSSYHFGVPAEFDVLLKRTDTHRS